MTEGLSDHVQLGALLNHMRCKRVAQGVNRRGVYARLIDILVDQVFDGSGADSRAELRNKEAGVLDRWPNLQISFESSTGFPVESDGAALSSLSQNVHTTDVPVVSGYLGRQFNVVEGQASELGQPDPGLQQDLDDGAVANLPAHGLQQALIFPLGQYARL